MTKKFVFENISMRMLIPYDSVFWLQHKSICKIHDSPKTIYMENAHRFTENHNLKLRHIWHVWFRKIRLATKS